LALADKEERFHDCIRVRDAIHAHERAETAWHTNELQQQYDLEEWFIQDKRNWVCERAKQRHDLERQLTLTDKEERFHDCIRVCQDIRAYERAAPSWHKNELHQQYDLED